MIFRKSTKTSQGYQFTGRYDPTKSLVLYNTTTYWFLFVPLYSSRVVIQS